MNSFELKLPVFRPWLAGLVSLAFLLMWDFLRMSLFVLTRIFHAESQVERAFSILIGIPFAAIAAGFTGTVAYYVLLNLAGSEELRLDPKRLAVRHSFLGLGRWKEFKPWEITDLRSGGREMEKDLQEKLEMKLIQEQARTRKTFAWVRGALNFFGLVPGVIFRAKKQVVWFGYGLEEMRAREILARLRMHLPEGAFTDTGKPMSLHGG